MHFLQPATLRRNSTGRITLLHLAQLLPVGGSAGEDLSGQIYHSFFLVLESRRKQSIRKLEELKDLAQKRGFSVEGRIIDSLEDTAHVILESVGDLKADLIVLGSHGRSGLSRILFGSVAQKVLEKAVVPVLLLHSSKEEKAKKK